MNCDLCGSTGSPLQQYPEARICDECGFIFVPRRRSPEEIAASWTAIYRAGGYDPAWPGVRARLFYVAEWLDQTIGLDGKTVLDIGAGNGQFLEYVRDRGGHPVGLEPDPENARVIRGRDIACHTGSTETIAEPGQFDLVTINWTLENCGDCLGMLKYAKNALAPGGYVSIATGSRILVPFKKPLSNYFGKEPADLHCFRWSDRSLSHALGKVGMKTGQTNDFMQRDEMIVLATPGKLRTVTDDPIEVHQFFAGWAQTWP